MVRKYTITKPRIKRESKQVYYLAPAHTTYWNKSDLKVLLDELKLVAEYHFGSRVGLIKFKNTDDKVPSFVATSMFMVQQISKGLELRTSGWTNPPVVKRKNW